MKWIYRNVFIFILLLTYLCSNAQTDSIFWFATPFITNKHNGPVNCNLTITARDAVFKTPIEISQPYNPSFPTILDTIDPGVSLTNDYFFDQAALYGFSNNQYNVLTNSALLIKSKENRKINAYFELHRIKNNPDIFTLKGSNALGTDFWIPFQDQWSNQEYDNFPAFSQINIVATKNNTNVTVTFQNDAYGYPAGTHVFTIDFAGQTLLLAPKLNPADPPDPSKLPGDRLIGTHIVSNKPIAVTNGDDSVIKGGAWDYIGDQLVPVKNLNGKATIGYEYVVMKGEASDNGGGSNEKVYVLITQDDTEISFQRKTDAGLTTLASAPNTAGSQYTINLFSAHHFVHIIANKPVFVFHVTGITNELGGAIVPTIDGCTGSKDVSFVRSKGAPQEYHLNIMTHQSAIDSFYLSTNNGPLTSIFTAADFESVGVGDFYVLKKGINEVTNDLRFPASVPLRLKNTVDVFHLGTINGVSSGGGCAYGYFSDYIELDVDGKIVQSNTPIITACYGDTLQLEVTEGHNTYAWSPIDYLDDPTVYNPKAFCPVGTHLYEVHVQGDCGLDTIVKGFQIEINQAVDAKFNVQPSAIGCAPFDITIQNVTTAANVYRWDFENDRSFDSDTTALSFTHRYENNFIPYQDTVYSLRLVAQNDSTGCGDEYTRNIRVHPEINAGFSQDKINGCNPLEVTFTDTSSGDLDTYIWKFGDGGESYTAGDQTHEFSHFVNDTVDYDVELTVTSPHFCRDTVRSKVSVFSYLESQFTIDDDDGCSPFTVRIEDASWGADSIFLSYGDGEIDTMLSFISINHEYLNNDGVDEVDTNIIEMRVKNIEGCEKFWYDTIFVYPEVHADYTIDPYVNCNFDPDSVTFHNTSNDGIHTASRYLWDFADGTNMDTTNNTIKKFYNNTTSSDQTYAFRLTARSNYGCTDEKLGTITMNRAYADFTVDNNEGCSPLNVLVTNNSIGDDIPLATGWSWDFDDGYTDANKNPLTHTYTNTTDANITRQLTLQVTGTGGCSTSKTIDITVYPQIKAVYDTTMFRVSSCDSLIVDFNSSTIHPGLNATALYTWNFGDGASSSAKGIIRHVYKNLASSTFIDRKVDLHVETPLGCSYDTTSFVRVYPMVNARIFIDKNEGCSPLTIDAEATEYKGIFPATNYVWDYGDTYTPNMSNPDPHQYPVNPPGGDDIYTLRLNVSDQTGTCTDSDTKTITVFDEALAQFTPTNSIDCNKYNLTFNNTSLNAVTYKWDFDDLTTSSAVNPTHIFTNIDPAGDAIYDVELEVTSNEGCTDIFNSNVSVHPYVNADFDIDISEECSPFTVTISNNSSGLEYYWFWNDTDLTLGNADSNSDAPTILAPYSLTTGGSRTDSLTLIVGNTQGCYDTLKRAVTVNSSIDAQFTYSQPDACNPSTVEFTSTTLYSNNYKWNFGDGSTAETTSPIISKKFTNNTAGDWPFNVVLTAESPEGCSGTTSDVVTVHSLVEADFDINISSGCSPIPVTFTNNSSPGAINYSWHWDNNDEIVDSAITTSFSKLFYNSTGVDSIYTLKLVVDNGFGCKDSISRNITVYSSLVAGFTFSQPDSCTNSEVTFTDITIPAVGGYTYNWDYGDGRNYSTTANSVVETFVNNTEYDDSFLVTLNVESNRGCPSTYSEFVTVYSKVVADFSIPLSAACPPFENARIINTSFGDNSNTYEWYVDGSATPDQTIIGTGDFIRDYDNTDHENVKPYPIRLVAYNSHGCTSEKTDKISVYEYVEAGFNMDLDKDCGSLLVNFTNNSLVPVGTTYSWDFNDGASSGDVEPTHEFFNSSRTDSISRIVNLEVSSPNFCTDDISQRVTIYNDPLAKFFVTPTSSCPPLNATLINNSEGADLFEWSFDDGKPNNTTQENLIYSWDNTDIDSIQYYKLKLWVGTDEGCTDSDSITLSVFPKVVADFTIDKDVGCSPLDSVQFTNTSTSPAKQFFWTFGDGTASNLPAPKHSFTNLGSTDKTYEVFLLASSKENCQDDTTKTVTVYVQPDAEFYMDPKLMVFPNNVVNLNNLTNFGPFEYNWSFGDLNNSTSTENQPNSFEYEHWGEKTITLEVNSTTPGANCTDTYSQTLLIMPPLVNADFTMDIDATCLNDNEEITFTAFPVFNYGDGYEYEWDFGDESGIETGEVVTHTYNSAGLFFVKLIARSTEVGREDEEDFVYKPVRIYANPVANIEVSPKISMLNSDLLARVEFFNLSECSDTSGCSYLWDFGDGSTAISKDVTHNYTEIGVYDVSLLVTTASGCKDSILLEDEVSIIGEGDIKFPNAFAPNSPIPYNQVFKPVSKGVIEYELFIYNRWGELIFTTKDLNAGWNGKINGDFAKPDVYVWKAEGKFTNGRSFELAGDITLIR